MRQTVLRSSGEQRKGNVAVEAIEQDRFGEVSLKVN